MGFTDLTEWPSTGAVKSHSRSSEENAWWPSGSPDAVVTHTLEVWTVSRATLALCTSFKRNSPDSSPRDLLSPPGLPWLRRGPQVPGWDGDGSSPSSCP